MTAQAYHRPNPSNLGKESRRNIFSKMKLKPCKDFLTTSIHSGSSGGGGGSSSSTIYLLRSKEEKQLRKYVIKIWFYDLTGKSKITAVISHGHTCFHCIEFGF
jgi:hypothetical protein